LVPISCVAPRPRDDRAGSRRVIPEGATAVAWKVGLSKRFAILLQAHFAGAAPGEFPNVRDGVDFPMSDDEMNWMLEFFRN
jgi:hypothetical protein